MSAHPRKSIFTISGASPFVATCIYFSNYTLQDIAASATSLTYRLPSLDMMLADATCQQSTI